MLYQTQQNTYSIHSHNVKKKREEITMLIDQLISSTSQFKSELSIFEENLLQVSQSLSEQQIAEKNISDVMDGLHEYMLLLNLDTRLETIIHDNVALQDRFDQFIDSLEQIDSALSKLRINSSKEAVSAIKNLSKLQDDGISQLKNHYKLSLQSISYPFPFNTFTIEDSELKINDRELSTKILHPISRYQLIEINKMLKILCRNDSSSVIYEYVQHRTNDLSSILSPFRSKVTTFQPKSGNHFNLNANPIYKEKSHPFHLLAFTICFLFERETEISSISFQGINNNAIKEIFQNMFTLLNNTLDSLCIPVSTHFDIAFEFDLHETISVLLQKSYVDVMRNEFTSKQKKIKGNIKNVLGMYLELLPRFETSSVPSGGDLTPLTKNLIDFLLMLVPYQSIFDDIDINFPLFDLKVERNETSHFVSFCTFALQGLTINLLSKSKSYSDKVIEQLFIMNNIYFASEEISKNDLTKMIDAPTIHYLEEITLKAQEEYMNLVWNTAFAKLTLNSNIFPPKVGQKFPKKDAQIIKKTFKNFCSKIDEIHTSHEKKYVLKHPKIMNAIQSTAILKCNSIYDPFWRKWKDSKFSQNPEKYITIQPNTLQQLITTLYSPKPDQK